MAETKHKSPHRHHPPPRPPTHTDSYMPDLLGVKVVGRLPRARRARLPHILEAESSAHTYQAEVAPAVDDTGAAAGGGGSGGGGGAKKAKGRK